MYAAATLLLVAVVSLMTTATGVTDAATLRYHVLEELGPGPAFVGDILADSAEVKSIKILPRARFSVLARKRDSDPFQLTPQPHKLCFCYIVYLFCFIYHLLLNKVAQYLFQILKCDRSFLNYAISGYQK